MPTLPVELLDIILDLHFESTSFSCEQTAKLCCVDRRTYSRAVKYLYKSPILHRNNIKKFVSSVGKDSAIRKKLSKNDIVPHMLSRQESLAELVQNIAFVSCDKVAGAEDHHEHVENDDIVECLELVSNSLQSLSIDMACSHAACGWYTDGAVRCKIVDRLCLPHLETLTCRCPKGYLPLRTRKLIELLRIGQSTALKTLNLVWTAPGPFDSPGHIANLSQTLELCPHVDVLRVIDTQPTTESRLPYVALRTICLPPELRWPIGLPHTWRDATLENGLPPYDDMFQRKMCIVQIDKAERVWLELVKEERGLSKTAVEMPASTRQLINEARTSPSDEVSRVVVRDHIYSIARALERLETGNLTTASGPSAMQRPKINLQRATIYTPKTRRHNARPWVETSRQIGHDAGWRAFVALQHSTHLPRSDEQNKVEEA